MQYFEIQDKIIEKSLDFSNILLNLKKSYIVKKKYINIIKNDIQKRCYGNVFNFKILGENIKELNFVWVCSLSLYFFEKIYTECETNFCCDVLCCCI